MLRSRSGAVVPRGNAGVTGERDGSSVSMLAALLLSSFAVQTVLETLAADAVPIAPVRIERVHELTQQGPRMPRSTWLTDEIRVAECAIERRVLGDVEQRRVFFALDARELPAVEVRDLLGARLIVFLQPFLNTLLRSASSPTRTRLAQLAGTDGPALPMQSGLWLIDGAEAAPKVRVPAARDVLPKALEIELADGRIALDKLLAWLDAKVARMTPSLHAFEVSSGPTAWSITLTSSGEWSGSTRGQLDPTEFADLWLRFEVEQFAQLPENVGRSAGPGEMSLRLRVRSLQGAREVEIHPCAPERLASDGECEQLARALRLWKALPGQRER